MFWYIASGVNAVIRVFSSSFSFCSIWKKKLFKTIHLSQISVDRPMLGIVLISNREKVIHFNARVGCFFSCSFIVVHVNLKRKQTNKHRWWYTEFKVKNVMQNILNKIIVIWFNLCIEKANICGLSIELAERQKIKCKFALRELMIQFHFNHESNKCIHWLTIHRIECNLLTKTKYIYIYFYSNCAKQINCHSYGWHAIHSHLTRLRQMSIGEKKN